jgi:K+-transporting ATPase c subunit
MDFFKPSHFQKDRTNKLLLGKRMEQPSSDDRPSRVKARPTKLQSNRKHTTRNLLFRSGFDLDRPLTPQSACIFLGNVCESQNILKFPFQAFTGSLLESAKI